MLQEASLEMNEDLCIYNRDTERFWQLWKKSFAHLWMPGRPWHSMRYPVYPVYEKNAIGERPTAWLVPNTEQYQGLNSLQNLFCTSLKMCLLSVHGESWAKHGSLILHCAYVAIAQPGYNTVGKGLSNTHKLYGQIRREQTYLQGYQSLAHTAAKWWV